MLDPGVAEAIEAAQAYAGAHRITLVTEGSVEVLVRAAAPAIRASEAEWERARIGSCTEALHTELGRPGFGTNCGEVLRVVPLLPLLNIVANGCMDTCDKDCENGPVHCSWIHEPNHKPGWHSAGDCPARKAAL